MKVLARTRAQSKPQGKANLVQTARGLLDGVAKQIQFGQDRGFFVDSYAVRALLKGSKVLQRPQYLHTAMRFCEEMIARQDGDGGWYVGYDWHQPGTRDVYLADGASIAMALAMSYAYLEGPLRIRVLAAAESFAAFCEKWVLPSGAVAVGRYYDRDDYSEFVTATANVTGLWCKLYKITGKSEYLHRARNAVPHLLKTYGPLGRVEYVEKPWGSRYPEDHYINISYYNNEALAWYYSVPGEKEDLRSHVRKVWSRHLSWLLSSQNEQGFWNFAPEDKLVNNDTAKSPGILCFLDWYERNVEEGQEISSAVELGYRFLLNPAASRIGVLEDRQVSAFAALAVTERLCPGEAF